MNNQKSIWFTSDFHIGHTKCLAYDNRPFRDTDHMAEVLIENYNKLVDSSSLCYFVGDMSLNARVLKPVLERLNGTKILILGNHDEGITKLYDCGFSAILSSISFYLQRQKITVSHCPLRGIFREDTSPKTGLWHGDHKEKHLRCSVLNEGQFHIHGHIHSRKDKLKSKRILGRQIDIGVTANHYRPVSISEIESWIAKTLRSEDEEMRRRVPQGIQE